MVSVMIEPIYKMATIPGGTFTNPENFHSHTFEPFQMGIEHVTVELWDFVAATLPKIKLTLVTRGPYKLDYPVTSISYGSMQEFIGRYSLYKGVNYRLPTQEEWEWACNGLVQTAFNVGDQISIMRDANFSPGGASRVNPITDLTYLKEADCLVEIGGHDYGKKMMPCRSYKPNQFGLYDMHGNAWDMTCTLSPQNNRAHAIKGGSYASAAHACRTYNRGLNFIDRNDWNNRLGFRLVCEQPPDYGKILTWFGS